MKVLTYNILFGMKGNTVWDGILSHLSMHGVYPILPFGIIPQWLRRYTVPKRSIYLKEVLVTIEKHNPDVLCLNEVLVDLQREELDECLRSLGFTTILYGVCLHHVAPFRISLVLATKQRSEDLNFKMTMGDYPGGAGGAASVYIQEYNLAVLGVHLALPGHVLDTEVDEIALWIKNQRVLSRNILLLGDFNLEKGELEKKIPSLTHFSENASPTCPSFQTFLKKSECLDHIFFDIHLTEVSSGSEQGFSDHKLLWSELSFRGDRKNTNDTQ